MENCKSKCSFYLFAYFVSLLVGTAIALLYGFGIIPLLTIAITGAIAIATLIFLIALGAKLFYAGNEYFPAEHFACILRHLAIEAILTVIFGLLTLVFAGFLIVSAIFLGITVAAFLATLISATAIIFSENCRCNTEG